MPDQWQDNCRRPGVFVPDPDVFQENGIGVIYQEFNLVGELSVAENIFLGRAIRKGIVIDQKTMVRESAAIFKQFDIDIDPNELVSNLTVGYQQLVEIAKAISQKANVFIMDEPSAPLTQTEAEHLYEMVEKLKASGVTIIYISHRMEEMFRLSDRITVMRDGAQNSHAKHAGNECGRPCETDGGQGIKGNIPGAERIVFLMKFCWMSKI